MRSAPASLLAALVALAVGAYAPLASGAPLRTLSMPGLFDTLATAEAHAYRVEGEWNAGCDSMILAGGSALDCFVITGELPMDATAAYMVLLDDLSKYAWTRWPRGWTSPSSPSLGLSMRTDSLKMSLLISLRAMKATMTVPGEGTAACDLPDRDYGELAWCLWGLDPESADVQPFVHDELRRLRMAPGMAPPEDFLGFLSQALRRETSPQTESEPPTVHAQLHTQVAPEYPPFARMVGIEGTVVLRARVDIDGRVGATEVIHSIPGLDMAARAAVSLWTFRPAMRGGAPVEDWIEVPVTFSLPREERHP